MTLQLALCSGQVQGSHLHRQASDVPSLCKENPDTCRSPQSNCKRRQQPGQKDSQCWSLSETWCDVCLCQQTYFPYWPYSYSCHLSCHLLMLGGPNVGSVTIHSNGKSSQPLVVWWSGQSQKRSLSQFRLVFAQRVVSRNPGHCGVYGYSATQT